MFRSIDNTIHSDFGSNAPQQKKITHTGLEGKQNDGDQDQVDSLVNGGTRPMLHAKRLRLYPKNTAS